MTHARDKTCDLCGTPAQRRYAVRVTSGKRSRVAMVGSSCARKFHRARTSDLISQFLYQAGRGEYKRIVGIHKSDRKEAVAEAVAKAMSWYGHKLEISDDEIDKLVTRIMEKMPLTVSNPRAWATTVTKHWIMDRVAKLLTAPRIEARKRAREEKREAEETLAAAQKSELREIIEELMDQNPKMATKNALSYVWYKYGRGMGDVEISGLMPGTTRDQRYQWRLRAVKLITPMASDSLRAMLSRHTWGRERSA